MPKNDIVQRVVPSECGDKTTCVNEIALLVDVGVERKKNWTPAMDDTTAIAVHRCRFVDYAPSPITALAFPPLPLPSRSPKSATSRSYPAFGTLAVGHANGNIDLGQWVHSEHPYQSPHAWVVRKVRHSPLSVHALPLHTVTDPSRPSSVQGRLSRIRHPRPRKPGLGRRPFDT
jgi:hypothetical protein